MSCDPDIEVSTDQRGRVGGPHRDGALFKTLEVLRRYRPLEGGGFITRRTRGVPARRAGCVERRSSGSTEARTAKGRSSLGAETNRAFYPME